ncbi:MAG: hypothetical protein V7L31_19895 [Nostoc sp.]
MLIRQYLTTNLETKYLLANRPIALNKTLTIDGINTLSSTING